MKSIEKIKKDIEWLFILRRKPLSLLDRPIGELNWGMCWGPDEDGYDDIVQAIISYIEANFEEKGCER